MTESPPQISKQTKHRIHTTINYLNILVLLSSIVSLLFSGVVYSPTAYVYGIGAGLTSILMMFTVPPAPDYFQMTLNDFAGDV